ncbi:hypothetical protein TNCV_3419281 [Trichonephila clavipes]|nr:hypothetical protein TNCV_3419281 [Trichonephila clavipes]
MTIRLFRCPPNVHPFCYEEVGNNCSDNITLLPLSNRPGFVCMTPLVDHVRPSSLELLPAVKCTVYEDNLVALHFKYDQARRRFVEWAQNEIAVVPDFHKRILFSDEAHFCLNGYVNKQNCRIWSEANPQVYVETPLHPEKLTVWCALWAGGILLQKR